MYLYYKYNEIFVLAEYYYDELFEVMMLKH